MMPFNTQAAGFGGWTITNTVAQGASTILTGSKEVILNGAKKIATGTAKITPTASQVSKVLARGGAGYALSVAVEQLLGAVDWVLDPANNQIKYWETVQVFQTNYNGIRTAQSQTQACQISIDYVKSNSSGGYSRVINGGITLNGKQLSCRILAYRDSAPNSPLEFFHYWSLTEVREDQPKTLPLPTVAAQVISNAESNTDKRAAAQVATTAAAADIVAEAETDNTKARPIINQFENTQTIPTDQTATGESTPTDTTGDPATQVPPSDLTLDFPVFCNWAPTVCLAAQTVISFPQTLINWWDSATTSISESWTWAKSRYEAAVTSISDFFKDESNTDTEFEFNDPTQITDTSISFSNQCPAPITLADFSYHGISQKWEMNFSPWCDVISTFIKPIVIAMASLSAVLIVSGVRENG